MSPRYLRRNPHFDARVFVSGAPAAASQLAPGVRNLEFNWETLMGEGEYFAFYFAFT